MSRLDDRLEQGLSRIADRATPSPDAWEAIQARIAEQADQPEMEITMLQKNQPPPRRIAPWVLGAAAAIIVVIIAVVSFSRAGDEGSSTVFADQPDGAEEGEGDGSVVVDPGADEGAEKAGIEAIALDFFDARAAWDGERARALVADDAEFFGGFVAEPDDLLLIAEFERALGWRYLDPECTASSPERVACTYSWELELAQALGVQLPAGNSFLLEMSDGQIGRVTHTIRRTTTSIDGQPSTGFEPDVWDPLRLWVLQNHPDDHDLMYEPTPTPLNYSPVITAQSIPLWEDHTAEFVGSISGTADPRIEDGLSTAIAFAEAQAGLDIDAMLAVGDGSNSLWGVLSGGSATTPLEADFRDAVGWSETVRDCAVSSTNEIGLNVTCSLVVVTAFSQALDVEARTDEVRYTVRYEGETHVGQTLDKTRVVDRLHSMLDRDRFDAEAWTPFVTWIEETHPDDLDAMFVDHAAGDLWYLGVGVPALTTESVDLWRQHTSEFASAQS